MSSVVNSENKLLEILIYIPNYMYKFLPVSVVKLVKSYIKGVNQFFGIKKENQYITFTLHNGRDFNLYEKSLENWLKGDDPLNKK